MTYQIGHNNIHVIIEGIISKTFNLLQNKIKKVVWISVKLTNSTVSR